MSGDFTIQMPTDLRSQQHTRMLPLDASPAPRKATNITRLTVDIPTSFRPQRANEGTQPPRWKTREFLAYYVVAAFAIPLMIWVPVSLSSSSHPNFHQFRGRLSQGWLFGRLVDNSDGQYRSFRNNFPLLTVLAGAFLLLKSIFTYALSSPRRTHHLHLVPFLVAFSILMLIGLHGTSIIKIFAILVVNYAIAKYTRGAKYGPWMTWAFNGLVLFANDRNSGYRFSSIHPSLEALDAMKGFYPRWHISFNITMLRLVSFNLDHYWACNGVGTLDTGTGLAEKPRTTTPHSLEVYSFINYLAYVLYAPLYIGGPIMTFNDFMWQLRRPTQLSPRMLIGYAIRFLACMLTMEFILHFMYVVAIKDTKSWLGDSPLDLSMIGFWNLMVVWLKLLLPWRFFRMWALLDGIDPPENMVRCMVNNYSPLGFWRAWHRSFNLWITRYIYIPLGGTKNQAVTTFVIFTFVALWHDLSFHLLAWGWLVSLFILPEIAAHYVLPASKYGAYPWYRHVCAIGGIGNILMMMSANLVGFVIGTDGMKYLLQQIVGAREGLQFLLGACFVIFVGIQLMFEYREEEMRNRIYRRC